MEMQGFEDPTTDAFDEIKDVVRSTQSLLEELQFNGKQSQVLVEELRKVHNTAWVWQHFMLGWNFIDDKERDEFLVDFEQGTAAAFRELLWILRDAEDLLRSMVGDWKHKAMKRADCVDRFHAILQDLCHCMVVVHEEIMEVMARVNVPSSRFDVHKWTDAGWESRLWEASEADVSELVAKMNMFLEERMKIGEVAREDDDGLQCKNPEVVMATLLTQRLTDSDRKRWQEKRVSNGSSSHARAGSSGGDGSYTLADEDRGGVSPPQESGKSGKERIRTLPKYLRVNAKQVSEIDHPLGQGSSGAVYAIRWLSELYAVKKLDSNYHQTFSKEAAILAHLKHPNVIQLTCFATDSDGCYIVMELVALKDLIRFINSNEKKKPPFSLPVAVDIMLQIARAMEYLHSKNVIHRDLKSLNVLVETEDKKDGRVRIKVADFGLSKFKLDISSSTTLNVGTPIWRAPEVYQLLGAEKPDPHPRYKKSADVYSFAITAYEILTGIVPFQNLTDQQLYDAVTRGDRPKMPEKIPVYLSACLDSWWAGDADSRPSFKVIRKMLEHLKRILVRVRHEQVEAFMDERPEARDFSLFSFFNLKDVECLIDIMGQEWCEQKAVGPGRIPVELYARALQRSQSHVTRQPTVQ